MCAEKFNWITNGIEVIDYSVTTVWKISNPDWTETIYEEPGFYRDIPHNAHYGMNKAIYKISGTVKIIEMSDWKL